MRLIDDRTALAMPPECWDASEGLALVLAGQGQVAAANQMLDSYAQKNPTQAQRISDFRGFYFGSGR